MMILAVPLQPASSAPVLSGWRRNKVGAVAGRELSRFARDSRDLQQLIEMCRVVDTGAGRSETVSGLLRCRDAGIN